MIVTKFTTLCMTELEYSWYTYKDRGKMSTV